MFNMTDNFKLLQVFWKRLRIIWKWTVIISTFCHNFWKGIWIKICCISQDHVWWTVTQLMTLSVVLGYWNILHIYLQINTVKFTSILSNLNLALASLWNLQVISNIVSFLKPNAIYAVSYWSDKLQLMSLGSSKHWPNEVQMV